MKYYRRMSEMRSQPFVVVFIDIDHFKKFNDDYGHETVDQEILPVFMRTLESFIFNHGYTYRFGGDEYKLLLPNINEKNAVRFLANLQESISFVQYLPIENKSDNPRISVGICEIGIDSVITDKEGIDFAEKAAMEAKQSGRNCIFLARCSGTVIATFEKTWPEI